MVYILLGTGFEEIEAVVPMDILRRGGVKAAFAGVGATLIKGGRGIEIACDLLVDDIDLQDADMIIIPGGLKGVKSIEANQKAMSLIFDAYQKKLTLAAICAGPRILGSLGILKGHRAVCYPGMEEQMGGAEIENQLRIVTDGNIITDRGPGTALDFGFEILKYLKGGNVAKQIASEMTYDH